MSHPARYRPYRLVLWIAYFAVALTFVGAIIQAGAGTVLREGNRWTDGPDDGGYPSSPR